MNLKSSFVELMCESGMLKFGDFTTKAGRKSPYFINSGEIFQSGHIRKMGQLYAQAIREYLSDRPHHLYGPAYKGIPLCNITAYALAEMGFTDYKVTYNRKETKDHGEGGNFIGAPLQPGSKVVIVEDVVSRGTSVAETMAALAEKQVHIAALLVGVDRMEKGYGSRIASIELAEKHNIKVVSIVTLDEIIAILSQPGQIDNQYLLSESMLNNIAAYRAKWS